MNTRQRVARTASKTEIHDVAPLEPATAHAQTPNFAHQFGLVSVYPDLEQSNSAQASFERGPFSSDINRVLGTAFNEPLEGLNVMRGAESFNQTINARASAIGSNIYLNADIEESLSSPASIEIIAHEVAHALRPSHGTKLLSHTSDSSERAAHNAGRAVRGGLERGAVTSGSASAAPSGEAVVQRWEGFEHKKSVDEAIGNLAPGTQIDPAARDLLEGKADADGNRDSRITLKNGLKVTPGQITALMGDLYGKFDKKTGKLDPAASFDQLDNAPVEEMNKLIALLDQEAITKKGTDASELEAVTRNRPKGESYLELAEKNTSHFSAATNTGTDNNLGTYSAFHQMAIEAMARGDVNGARALEASSMHYLTDRHSAGHSFDKAEAMKGTGVFGGDDGIIPNLKVLSAHDAFNKEGRMMSNEAGDKPWLAMGDGEWDNEKNKDNRQQTSQSVLTSWNELAQSGKDQRSPAEFEALKTAPKFNPKLQKEAEQKTKDTSLWDIAKKESPRAGDAVWAKAQRYYGKIENGIDWIGDKAKGAWNAAGKAADWVGDRAGDAWDATKTATGKAADWVGDKATGAWNAAGKAADWAGDTASSAAGWVGDKAEGAWNAAGTAANWAGDKAEKATDWVGDKASSAVNYVEDNFTLDPRKMEFDPRKWF